MNRNRGHNNELHPIYSAYREVVHHWMLQLLIPLGAYKGIVSDHHYIDDVLNELGLTHLLETEEFNTNAARQALQKMYCELDLSPAAEIPGHTQLAKNIQWLGQIIGLNEIEQSILNFRIVASRHLILRTCLLSLGQGIDLLYAANIFALLLGVRLCNYFSVKVFSEIHGAGKFKVS